MLKIASPRASFSSSTKRIRARNLRSVSFPARSSSNVQKLEQELDKLISSSLEPPSSSLPLDQGIIARLSSVSEVYRRIGELLSQPGAHQALASEQDHPETQWAHHMSDDLIRYLDVCTITRDSLLAMQESARDLLSSLRRISKSKGSSPVEYGVETGISSFLTSRKNAKREAAKSLASLKHAGDKLDIGRIGSFSNDLYTAATVGAVREASYHTVSVFGELLSCLSAKCSKAGGKWSLVAKLVHIKGCELESGNKKKMNELESVVAVLHELCSEAAEGGDYMAVVELAQNRLEVLDRSIGRVEKELECLFRRLIQARVSLLNLLSH
ncbi:hypothetical protein LINGRAHAP2_LOCUS31181 [Linum grandiflorum]